VVHLVTEEPPLYYGDFEMPLTLQTVQEVKTVAKEAPSFSSGEKMDVLFVIMIVLLLFAFKNVTAFLMKGAGLIVLGLGVYTLLL